MHDRLDLDDEDRKLVTLARSARARTAAPAGAAVRDDMGRTYAAATVGLPSLSLTALQVAVASAVSGGSERLEAAVVHTDSAALAAEDVALLDDLAASTVVLAATDGSLTRVR